MEWRETGDVPFSFWRDTLAAVDSPLLSEAESTYAVAEGYTALALAMMKRESQFGTHYRRNTPANRNVFNLRPRRQDGYQSFATWTAGVKEWKARITDPEYAYVDTITVLDLVEIFAPESDDNDPVAYAEAVEHLIRNFPKSGGTDMTDNAQIRAPFRVSLIPEGNPNRPGSPLNTNDRFWFITQHTTGNTNPGATAVMHEVFTHQGGGSSRVSFHFVVDDKGIIQLLPVYEIGWHAGDGCDDRGGDVGCFDSIGIELCVYSGQDWMKAKENLAILYAMLVRKDPRIVGIDRGDFSLGRIRTHQQVSDDRKYCPTQLLNEGSMPVIIGRAEVIAGGVTNEPKYAKPSAPAWLADDDKTRIRMIGRTKVYPITNEYTVLRSTERRQATGTNKNLVGPNLKKGEKFEAHYAYRSNDVTYILTDYGTRVEAAALLPKVQVSASNPATISVRYELPTG